MHRLFDDLAVTLVILAALLYVLMVLGPRALRRGVLAGLSALLAQLPPALRLAALANRLRSAAAVKAKGACGGCDDCGSQAESGAGETRIPLSKIGRR
jgi:hypothetical protein